MRVPIPFMQTGECLHTVGSSKATVFPQQVGMAATFDPDLVYRVGRAIGSEARAIGIHACFSPVLDLGKDSRWGRIQEDFGEYFIQDVSPQRFPSWLSWHLSCLSFPAEY
jgi:beta-glucosidase-like glycosyl hydrolase